MIIVDQVHSYNRDNSLVGLPLTKRAIQFFIVWLFFYILTSVLLLQCLRGAKSTLLVIFCIKHLFGLVQLIFNSCKCEFPLEWNFFACVLGRALAVGIFNKLTLNFKLITWVWK